MISVIIPVYNEEKALPALLARLDSWYGDCEFIFADGGSTDATLALLQGRHVLRGAKGRGAQCNLAAKLARGDILWFLHCDSVVDDSALEEIAAAVRAGADWGALRLRFDDRAPVYRLGAALSNLRLRWGHIAFGDQGIFMSRRLFGELGGFPDLPLMEDYQLSLNLKARGSYPRPLKSEIITSARRFQEGGALRVGWQMQRLRAMYRRGVDIDTIAQVYGNVRKQHG